MSIGWVGFVFWLPVVVQRYRALDEMDTLAVLLPAQNGFSSEMFSFLQISLLDICRELEAIWIGQFFAQRERFRENMIF